MPQFLIVDLDCSGAVFRAAQIVGLPCFSKNTTTLSLELKDVPENDLPRKGDLIFYPGHVTVVSDCEKNLTLETVGYSAGFGYLQEIELSRIFDKITTYQDLKTACSHKDGLTRKKKSGAISKTYDVFRLLTMRTSLQAAV